MRSRLLLTVVLIVPYCLAEAQARADSLIVAHAETNLRKLYYDNKKGESLLYVGSDYAEYESLLNEHPFFLDNDWQTGTVHYNGNYYINVPLQYDIRSQKLLTEHATSGRHMQLVTEHVRNFSLGQRYFDNLSESDTRGLVSPGFYEVLAEGKTRLLARRGKALQESTVTGQLEVRFEESVKYYVSKDNQFYQVKGKSSILKVFADHKRLLASKLKQQRVKFDTDKEGALIQTVLIYNSISE
jgi:hypothetical protein